MKLFLFACAVILAVTAGYFFYRLKWSKSAFRLQSRLTLLTLLVTLTPSILLILFAAYVLNVGFETLVWSDFEESLDYYTEAIRGQLIIRNERYLDGFQENYTLDDLIEWSERGDLLYVFRLRMTGGKAETDTLYTRDPAQARRILLNPEDVETILAGGLGNILYQEDAIYESYRFEPDSTILAVGLQVDSLTMQAIGRIDRETVRFARLEFLEERFSNRNIFYISGLILLLFIAACVIAVVSRMSAGINRPIRELVLGFKKVGEGDLDVAVSADARDEMQFLLSSFNAMTGQLKESRRRLVQTERLAAWRDVARQISHEIKNPLTPIQLSLHRLRKKIEIPAGNEKAVMESFRAIEEEIESLRRIATEFSEFARMPNPVRKPAGVNDILTAAAALYEQNKRNVPVTAQFDASIPKLELDAEQVKRVFINLIKNAIEASDPGGGPVGIFSRYRLDGPDGVPYVEVQVIDRGCGMDDETMKKMFDPYFTTKKDGTGLGMPIIRRIVEEHGGDIRIASAPGAGTTVSILFPA